MPSIKGFLIDIDGVVYVDKQAVTGAVEAIEFLQKKRFPFILATNTTRRSRFSLLNKLKRLGIKVEIDQIFSAPLAAVRWLNERNVTSISLFLRGDTYREFKDFRITSNKPEYLLIGDIGEDLTYSNLNQAFRLIMNGTRMLALQKNRYWVRNNGLVIDTGAIVASLEYATRKRAKLIGKPSLDFFDQAIKQLNLPLENIAIIGDDLDTDIIGGARAGLYTIAVQTGKFCKKKHPKKSPLPHQILNSIADLPKWIKSQVSE